MSSREFKLLIAFLSFTFCAMFFIMYKNEPFFNMNNSKAIYLMSKENDSLKNEISLERIKISEYQCKIDSLEDLKPQVIIKYVQKNKSIDNANVNDLVNEYKGIFTKSNIK